MYLLNKENLYLGSASHARSAYDESVYIMAKKQTIAINVFDQLDAVTSIMDIQPIGHGIHKLSGNMADFWAIKITPNYRMIFRFEYGEILDLDFIDYH